jgi:excisionase family DNA binding protein
MMNQLLNVHQAAIQLGLKDKTIRQWIALRKIEYVKAGAAVRIRQSEINRIIRSGTVSMHRAENAQVASENGPTDQRTRHCNGQGEEK